MSHLSVSANFGADDVHIAHEDDEHPTCHQIEIRPQLGVSLSLFGDAEQGGGSVEAARALREALAKAVVLLDSRLLLLERAAAEAEAVPA